MANSFTTPTPTSLQRSGAGWNRKAARTQNTVKLIRLLAALLTVSVPARPGVRGEDNIYLDKSQHDAAPASGVPLVEVVPVDVPVYRNQYTCAAALMALNDDLRRLDTRVVAALGLSATLSRLNYATKKLAHREERWIDKNLLNLLADALQTETGVQLPNWWRALLVKEGTWKTEDDRLVARRLFEHFPRFKRFWLRDGSLVLAERRLASQIYVRGDGLVVEGAKKGHAPIPVPNVSNKDTLWSASTSGSVIICSGTQVMCFADDTAQLRWTQQLWLGTVFYGAVPQWVPLGFAEPVVHEKEVILYGVYVNRLIIESFSLESGERMYVYATDDYSQE